MSVSEIYLIAPHASILVETPEGDISVVEARTMEPLPVYVEEETPLTALQAVVAGFRAASSPYHPLDRDMVIAFVESQTALQPGTKDAGPPEPILEYPQPSARKHLALDGLMLVKQAIVTGFFSVILRGDGEKIALLINSNLVTANTTNDKELSPLLAAVGTRNVQIIEELLGYGADPNAFGVNSWEGPYNGVVPIKRTPLQLAASIGHLPLVKLLMEVHHADDALIAPDGQIALRLAAEAGHRAVVDYLPARRGGGFRRWRHHHQKALRRIAKALRKIYEFSKFFVWDLPEFFLWYVPKHVVVKPLVKGCKWCWKHKHLAGPWCAHQLGQIPERAKRFGKAMWKGVKAVPKAAAAAGKAVWKFGTSTLPRWVGKLVSWIWSLFTTRIPKAIAIAAKWIWAGMTAMGAALLDVILKTASLLHTVLEAVVTFFRDLTLQDVWNGFCNLLHAVFVAFPRALGSWILKFSDASFKFMKAVFGEAGEILWWLVVGIGWVAAYVPRKFWIILKSLGSSFTKAWYEVVVFVKPKA